MRVGLKKLNSKFAGVAMCLCSFCGFIKHICFNVSSAKEKHR